MKGAIACLRLPRCANRYPTAISTVAIATRAWNARLPLRGTDRRIDLAERLPPGPSARSRATRLRDVPEPVPQRVRAAGQAEEAADQARGRDDVARAFAEQRPDRERERDPKQAGERRHDPGDGDHRRDVGALLRIGRVERELALDAESTPAVGRLLQSSHRRSGAVSA